MKPQEEIERLKAQLADRDARWYALLESSAQIVWATDASGTNTRDLQLDKAQHLSWSAFTGQPEVFGDTSKWLEVIHPDDIENVIATWSDCLRTGRHYRCEYRLRHRSGEWRWMLFQGTSMRDASGAITGWSGIGTDITRRRQVEDALRESQQHLMTALEVGGMGIVVVRLSDHTVWWDQAAKQLWDVDPTLNDHSLDGVLSRHVHEDDRAQVRDSILELIRTGQPSSAEYRAKQRDGSIKWVAVHGQLKCDSNGTPVQIISAHTDITKLKVAEESLRQTQTMQALGTLAGGVAHDFNNLLLAINGNARLALDCSIDSDAKLAIDEIIKAGDRATALVRRILTFSAQHPREQASVFVCAAVRDAMQLFQTSVPSNVDVHAELPAQTLAVSLDNSEIQQIILSLLNNAVDAIGQRAGSINVSVEMAAKPSAINQQIKHFALLTVRDNGGGMNATTRERVFEPFFTTKPVGKGTGLSLAVVHGIVQSCGGEIEINSAPGIGTTFKIWLPLATDVSENTHPPLAKPMGHGERILYVDDDDAIVLLISRSLQQLGYRVTGHTGAHEALEQLANNADAFDVVVTDLSMPEMSGFDLAAQVKKIRPSLPIVMTSGYVRTQDEERARSLGIEHIILKPNTIEELGQVLDKICRGIGS